MFTSLRINMDTMLNRSVKSLKVLKILSILLRILTVCVELLLHTVLLLEAKGLISLLLMYFTTNNIHEKISPF